MLQKISRVHVRNTSFSKIIRIHTATYSSFSFTIQHQSAESKARTGTLETPHGIVSTPNFVFCATKAAVKAMTPTQVKEANSQIILSNTYHLMLTPGADLIEQMGGLQKFTGWNGPMLTDSGGYQIFSMGCGNVSSEIKGNRGSQNSSSGERFEQTLLKITEEGATFKSFIDGTIHELTPEKSVQIQRKLGADLIVVFDECTPFNVSKEYTEASMYRSHRWAVRSLNEFNRLEEYSKYKGKQALYGIVQGGVYKDLRDVSTAFVNEHSFFGTAIGGSLGASRKEMYDIVKYTRERVRDDRPVHLLGIGGVRDIFHGVRQGIDTFDCVHPSRLGRHGGALVMAAHWREDLSGGDEVRVTETASTSSSSRSVKDIMGNRWKKLITVPILQRIEYYNNLTVKQKAVLRECLLEERHALQAKVASMTAAAESLLTQHVTQQVQQQEEKPVNYRKESKSDFLQRKFRDAILSSNVITDRLELYNVDTNVVGVSSPKQSRLASSDRLRMVRSSVEDVSVDDSESSCGTSVNASAAVCSDCSSKTSGTSSLDDTVDRSSGGDHTRYKKKQTIREHINITKGKFRSDPRPIDVTCGCYTCKTFSRAYLYHLFKAEETLGGTLMTIHNVYFMNRLMTEIRQGIKVDDLDAVEKAFVHPELMNSNMDELISEGIGA